MELPLFSGYLFCRLPEQRFLPILNTPGVVQVLGYGAKPEPVATGEIDAIRRIVGSGHEALPWPYLSAGQRVKLRAGPLRNLEGILENADGRERVVVNVELLQRSVAVAVDRMDLEPIWHQ